MNNGRFKFRVWDSLINEYHKEGTVQLSGNGQPFIIDGNMQPQDIDNVIIEQCTGVKDKNGKLIYDGDILRATCADGKHIDYPVGWWDGAFHLYYVNRSLIAETGTIQFCLRGHPASGVLRWYMERGKLTKKPSPQRWRDLKRWRSE